LQSELVALQQSAAQVAIPNAAIDLIEQLRRDLAGKGIIISDRRWGQTLGMLQSHALTEGRDAVTEDDLQCRTLEMSPARLLTAVRR
jgi:MoxR-like ATPase